MVENIILLNQNDENLSFLCFAASFALVTPSMYELVIMISPRNLAALEHKPSGLPLPTSITITIRRLWTTILRC